MLQEEAARAQAMITSLPRRLATYAGASVQMPTLAELQHAIMAALLDLAAAIEAHIEGGAFTAASIAFELGSTRLAFVPVPVLLEAGPCR